MEDAIYESKHVTPRTVTVTMPDGTFADGRRQGARIVVSQTCGRVCANRLIAKRRQWKGAA